MAEIQDAPQAGLALILADDRGLDLAAAGDHGLHDLMLASQYGLPVLLEEAEERLIVDDSVLYDLAEPRVDLGGRRSVEQGEVHDDRARLIECSDQVLAEPMIDGYLAAYAGIDLGQEARRYLDERYAAHIGRRDEAGQITDHAAAERDDRRAAVQTVLDAFRIQLLGLRQALRRLANRYGAYSDIEAVRTAQVAHLSGIVWTDVRVGNEQAPSRVMTGCYVLAQQRHDPIAYMYIVAVPAQFYRHDPVR